jgi:uncharacterized protein (TIGR00304 family)
LIGALLLPVVLFAVAFLLIVVGSILVFLGMLREGLRVQRERVEGGAVVVVGPLPIVIGTSRESAKILMILAIALTVIAVAVFLFLTWGLTQLVKSLPPPSPALIGIALGV